MRKVVLWINQIIRLKTTLNKQKLNNNSKKIKTQKKSISINSPKNDPWANRSPVQH